MQVLRDGKWETEVIFAPEFKSRAVAMAPKVGKRLSLPVRVVGPGPAEEG